MGNVNLATVFLTGLFTGGLTCLATQGGLLATTIANRQEDKFRGEALRKSPGQAGNAFPILSFLIAKLVVYTILGFLLGWFGSVFQLSLTVKVAMQFAVGIFMLGTALNLLNVHPIFRYFIIQPPKFVTRIVRNQAKSSDFFSPALLGAFTVFIPCGTTQAMMALAIASGSPLLGATILFAFTLGTSPLFFLLGYFATRLGDVFQQKFMKVAAYAIIALSIWSINGAVALSGSTITLQSVGSDTYCTFAFCDNSPVFAKGAVLGEAVSEATITIEGAGYSPNNLVVKAGSLVTLKLVNTSGGGCTQAFAIPKLGIQKVVPLGSSDVVQFTAPNTPGTIAFSCGMGMFGGKIQVVKS